MSLSVKSITSSKNTSDIPGLYIVPGIDRYIYLVLEVKDSCVSRIITIDTQTNEVIPMGIIDFSKLIKWRGEIVLKSE